MRPAKSIGPTIHTSSKVEFYIHDLGIEPHSFAACTGWLQCLYEQAGQSGSRQAVEACIETDRIQWRGLEDVKIFFLAPFPVS
jgi:hypothetical protein